MKADNLFAVLLVGDLPAHAADDTLTLLQIQRRTLYNARAAKMVCEVDSKLLRFLDNRHFCGLF
jgi:hypothetical protein